MLVVCVIYEGELLSNVINTDGCLLSIDGRLLATAFGNQGPGYGEFVVQFHMELKNHGTQDLSFESCKCEFLCGFYNN